MLAPELSSKEMFVNVYLGYLEHVKLSLASEYSAKKENFVKYGIVLNSDTNRYEIGTCYQTAVLKWLSTPHNLFELHK